MPRCSAPLLRTGARAPSTRGRRRVACGVGPGPYTGLRVGIASGAWRSGAAWGGPCIGVCSLDAMAAGGRHVDATDLAEGVSWRPMRGGPRCTGPRYARACGRVERAARRAGRQTSTRGAPGAVGRPRCGPAQPGSSDGPRRRRRPRARTRTRRGWAARQRAAGGGSGRRRCDRGAGRARRRTRLDRPALAGAALLPPRPLYLRRPDAVGGRGCRMTRRSAAACAGGMCRTVRRSRGSCSPIDAWSAEQFWQELAQPTRHYVVADGRGATSSGTRAHSSWRRTADVQTVAVRADQPGSRRGVALLDAL